MPPSDLAELSTLRAQLEELAARVLAVGDRYRESPDSAVTNDLELAERSLLAHAARSSAPPAPSMELALDGEVALGSADGQMSTSTQPGQFGLRAKHTRRPCRMSRSEKRPRSSGGTSTLRSSSAFTGSVSVVSFRRRAKRPTCVSTGRPGRSNATDRTTLPVLRPTPGQLHEVVELGRHLAVELLVELARHAEQVLRLRPEEAGGVHDRLHVGRIGVREIARRRVLREQLRRDLVDVLVGGLRGEDRRRQQLVRVRVHQRALRAWILLREPRDHLGRARFRSSGSRHVPTLNAASAAQLGVERDHVEHGTGRIGDDGESAGLDVHRRGYRPRRRAR